MILQAVCLAVGTLVWGAHAHAAGLPPRARRTAVLVALPSAIAACIAMFAATAVRPDAALAAGLGPRWPVSIEGRAAAILLLATLAGDAMAFLMAREENSSERVLAALLGLAGLVGFAIWGELLRIGENAGLGETPFWLAVILRAVIGLGAGEIVLARRARFAVPAGLALLAYPLILSEPLRQTLELHGDWLSLGAAGLLFVAAGLLPRRLSRLALAAAVLVTAVFLARVTDASDGLAELQPELWQVPAER